MYNYDSAPVQRTALPPSFNDLPPPEFIPACADEGEAPTPPPAFATPPAPEEKKVTRNPVRIVRAVTGATELRLLSERTDGQHMQYMLERARIRPPYERDVAPLVKTSGDIEVPMKKHEADRAFDRAVKAAYPVIELRPGTSIPTSTVIL